MTKNACTRNPISVRWIALASLLFTTACLDERCGITSPTAVGSHDESTQNLTVIVKVSRTIAAAQVRVVAKGQEARLSPNVDNNEQVIELPDMRPDETVIIDVWVNDLGLGERLVKTGFCTWDGKTSLIYDPEIFVYMLTATTFEVECNEWDD